jgi:hypothetical protein
MKNIVDVINEAVSKPITFVQSWSSNPPMDIEVTYIDYDRIDAPLDEDLGLSPEFLKWYNKNATNLDYLVIYHNSRRDYFAVVGARQFADEGYPVFAEMLSTSGLEEWLKKNGKSTSTKVSKY